MERAERGTGDGDEDDTGGEGDKKDSKDAAVAKAYEQPSRCREERDSSPLTSRSVTARA